MGNVKQQTYWDEIKNQETHFTSQGGWEIHLNKEEYYTKDVLKTRLQFSWPRFDGLNRKQRALERASVMKAAKARKLAAQMSRNREEYTDIFRRINEDQLLEIVGKEKPTISLGDYIRQHYLTDAQAYTLFYRM
jgi:hypothetical protein